MLKKIVAGGLALGATLFWSLLVPLLQVQYPGWFSNPLALWGTVVLIVLCFVPAFLYMFAELSRLIGRFCRSQTVTVVLVVIIGGIVCAAMAGVGYLVYNKGKQRVESNSRTTTEDRGTKAGASVRGDHGVGKQKKQEPQRTDKTEHGIKAGVRTSLISFGSGSCSMFMNQYQAGMVTPISIIAWVRLVSSLDYGVQVDSYSMEVANDPTGPWNPTRSIPLDFGSLYTVDNAVSDRNTDAFRRSIAASFPGSQLTMQVGGVYAFSTADDPNCIKKVGLVQFRTLSKALHNGLPPHYPVEGWTAFNPLEAVRGIVLNGKRAVYYRITIRTTGGNFVDSGRFEPTINSPQGKPENDEIGISKFTGEMPFESFGNSRMVYWGP